MKQTVPQITRFVSAKKSVPGFILLLQPPDVLFNLLILRLYRNLSKIVSVVTVVTANCVICGMDIQPNIGYTTHGDSPLFVVIPVFVVWLFTL